MWTMYDAIPDLVKNIPIGAAGVAGYVDGRYAWRPEHWARFATPKKVRIAVFASTNDGDVLDCENGDATPGQCPGWIRMRQAAGIVRPTIYCNLSSIAAVQAACTGLVWDWWCAHPQDATLYPGSVATQYGFKGIYDLSICMDNWPSRLQSSPVVVPVPPIAPPTPGPAHPFPGLMRLGTMGSGVRGMQARLIARGWHVPGGADGNFGPGTLNVVRQFQAEKHLTVDGIVGPMTWAALWNSPIT